MCVSVCVCIHTYILYKTHTHTHTHTHTQTTPAHPHIHTQTYTHTYIYSTGGIPEVRNKTALLNTGDTFAASRSDCFKPSKLPSHKCRSPPHSSFQPLSARRLVSWFSFYYSELPSHKCRWTPHSSFQLLLARGLVSWFSFYYSELTHVGPRSTRLVYYLFMHTMRFRV